MRGGRLSNVLLEEVLRDSLKRINRIQHKGDSYLFSEENLQSAIQRLKNVKYDGLLKTNESVYDLLTLGVALEQSVEGAVRSFTLNYIDWKNPQNNVYHVTAEYSVERTRSHETARPDIVLFVNGIPFAVIECKSPNTEVAQAVSQMIRNQRDEYEYLIGCASISMADGGHNAANLYRQLAQRHLSPIEYRVFPKHSLPHERLATTQAAQIPPLIKGYLRLGAWICGEPAWDPDFNSADLLILLPLSRLSGRYAQHFIPKASN